MDLFKTMRNRFS